MTIIVHIYKMKKVKAMDIATTRPKCFLSTFLLKCWVQILPSCPANKEKVASSTHCPTLGSSVKNKTPGDRIAVMIYASFG